MAVQVLKALDVLGFSKANALPAGEVIVDGSKVTVSEESYVSIKELAEQELDFVSGGLEDGVFVTNVKKLENGNVDFPKAFEDALGELSIILE